MIDETPKTLSETEQATALNNSFDESKLTFHSRPEALAAFKVDRDIVWEDGQPFALYDGVVQPLADALAKFGADNRGHIDGRSLPRQGVDASRPGTTSKSSFSSIEEKVAWIQEHGSDAYERLPLKAQDTSELTHQAQWYGLPIEERVRLTQLDPNAFAKLKPGAAHKPFYVNQAAIDREAAKRGTYRR